MKQISTADGYFTNAALGTGTTVMPDPYRFQTPQVQNGTTYRSTVDFMVATGGTNNEASGGIWQNSLDNPDLPAKCGIRVAILHDLSNSVTSADLTAMKKASTSFVDSLVGTPSQVSTFTFASTAPAAGSTNTTLPLTPVSTAAGATTVKDKINAMALPGLTAGGTNWDRGIYQVAQSASSFDVLVVITDGNPTYYGNQDGPGTRTRFREVENGIFSANAVKAEDTKLLAVGVGEGVNSTGSGLNLRSISGPTLGTDYYQTSDYAAAGDQLRKLALGSCLGSVPVVKQVVPSGTAAGNTTGAQPQGGWTFSGTGTTGVTFDAPTSRTTATGTGAANFPLTFAGGTVSGTVTLTETPQTGYMLHQGVVGQNAVCTRVDTGATIVPGNVTNGFTVAANSAYPVSCTVYNEAPTPLASVVVDKQWRIDGTDYAEGGQPGNFVAGATIAGTAQGWGVERTGFREGDRPTIDESISNVPIQCTVTARQVVAANGATVAQNLPYSPTLEAGQNTYTIRNVVTCQTKLTLTKTVQGGTEPVTSWTLDAVAPTGALTGPNGTSGSARATGGAVTPGVTYALAETGDTTGTLNYTQLVDPNANLIPGSSGSWTCQEVGADGTTVIPGFADGLNGGVTVPLGKWVRCNAVNRTSTLILRKVVQNTHGGTAVPSNWTLSATPTGAFPTGLPTQTVTGSTVGASFNVRPGVAYRLAESGGPAGYALDTVVCDIVPGNLRVDVLTLNPLDTGVCTFTNVDQPATLSLVKTVTNDNGGTALPTAWTLNAAGPTPISGSTGSDPVTDAAVNAGTYTLSESGGPAGYTAGNWTCTGGVLTGSSIVVANGTSATCTINNNDQGARLTLVKTVTNDNGGTALPTAWTLAAAGPTPISGSTGSAAITDAAVNAGTYALSESGPDGYTAGNWTCTAGALSGSSLTLPLNTSATCTIDNNDQAATLTLAKIVDNGTTGATASPAQWTLTASGPTRITGAGNSAAVTNRSVSAGSYVLSESGGPAGYTTGAWSCSGGTLTGSDLTVSNGSNVTCTITNTAQQPRLTLVKVVDNGSTGATTTTAAWTLSAVGPQTITGTSGAPAVTNAALEVGQYDLTEVGGPAGYTASTWVCSGGAATTPTSVTLATGSDATCTITNTAQQPHLTLVKTVTNDNGGTALPIAWTLSANGPTTGITGPTGSGTVTNVPVRVGSYTLAEAGGPAGYTAGDWSCTGATVVGTSLGVTLGADVTCTIANDDQPASLTLVKTVTNDNGGAARPTAWTLSATGPTTITGATGSTSVTDAPVSAGTYTLAETGGPGGYTAGTWACTAGTLTGASLVIANGVSATCTLGNDDEPAQLTLVKTVTNDNGGTAEPTDWTLTASGPTPITGTTGDAAITDAVVNAGDYTLSETGPDGYTGGNWTCGDEAQVNGDVVTVPNGGNVTCSIDNDDQAALLTLVKVVDNGTTGATYGPGDWTLMAAGPTTVSGAGNSPDVTAQTVPAGTFALSETDGPDGYTASDWTCTGATVTDDSVVVPNGGDVSCTITNTVVQPTLTLVKAVANGASGGTAAPADWTLSAAGPTTILGDGNSAEVTGQPVPVGDYSLDESGGPDGYSAGVWSCTGADSFSDTGVTIAAGNDAVCTITNTAAVPSLTLVKVVDNADTGATTEATAWTLTADGPTTISGATGTSEAAQVGTYVLSESGPDGYDASDWTCTGADSSTAASVTLALDDDATCTITNTAQPSRLTLVKTVTNDNGGTAAPTDWTLSADGPTTGISGPVGDAAVTNVPVQVGDYTLDENALLTGYTAGDWSCDAGTLDGTTLTIALGDDATCTIDNDDQPAQLTLVKTVDNGTTGGTAVATDWTLVADGPTPISGSTGNESVTDAIVNAGDYPLSESGPGGYTAGDWTCGTGVQVTGAVVTVPNGGDVTCTIRNIADQARLTLVKTVTNDNGGSAVPTDWTLSATGPTLGLIGRVGDASVTEAAVQIGDYDLAESGGPDGYTAGNWTCDAGTLDGTTLTIDLGRDITCTIDNDDEPAQLTLLKVVDNADTGAPYGPGDWILTADGPTPISGEGNSSDVTSQTVDAGVYTLSETGRAGTRRPPGDVPAPTPPPVPRSPSIPATRPRARS